MYGMIVYIVKDVRVVYILTSWYIFEEKKVRSETIYLLLFVKKKVRSKIAVFDHFFFPKQKYKEYIFIDSKSVL